MTECVRNQAGKFCVLKWCKMVEKENFKKLLGKGFVKILGTRLGKFIEFEFSLNDSDLAVELILPPEAFKAFCEANDVVMLSPDPKPSKEVAGLLGKFLPDTFE